MASVGGAAATGLEAGFNLGLRADQFAEEKRARQYQETRQHAADLRAEEELGLHKQRQAREDERLANQEKREAGDRAARGLSERQKLIVAANQSRQLQGLPVDPEDAAEYGRNAQALSKIRQDSLDYWSRVQTGQSSIDTTSPKDLYMHMTAATGMLPEELATVPQSIADVQAGMETNNKGLVLKGMNALMAPRLRKGVGGPSPYGGTILKKEIIGIDPARDANGVDHPDKFIPRLRVYVKTDDGQTKYYDAPATVNGSTDPEDKVAAVNLSDALDYMGNMGNLATVAQHPEIQAKLQQGAKEVGPAAKKYLEELTALSAPAKPKLKTEQIRQGGKITRIVTDEATGKEVKREEFTVTATPRQFRSTSAAAGTMRAKLGEIDQMLEDEEITPEEAAEMKKSVVAGIKPPKAAGAGKGPSNAELKTNEQGALDAVAGRLGLDYDTGLKAYRNRDGTPATPEQKAALARAREAITKASRDAAAAGKRTPATGLVEAGVAAGGAKPKYTEGQTATGPGGKKMIFKGGAWQPLNQ